MNTIQPSADKHLEIDQKLYVIIHAAALKLNEDREKPFSHQAVLELIVASGYIELMNES